MTTKTKESPILFSARMVRAILDGRKTQTRRIIKPQPPADVDALHGGSFRKRAPYKLEHYETGAYSGYGYDIDEDGRQCKCPYGMPGDRLWVREAWAVSASYDHCKPSKLTRHIGTIQYAAGGGKLYDHVLEQTCFDVDGQLGKGRPSIFMPRWASRITLEVLSVRVERLNEISEEDAQSEGVEFPEPYSGVGGKTHPTCIDAFQVLWESINGPDSWNTNPWVWVVQFKTTQGSMVQR